MISIAVVEDDQEYQKQLLQYIEQYGKEQEAQYKITVFQNGMNFLDDYKGDCDLIFMDIAMPHMDGLETAAALRKRGDNTCLIFITSMAQYALKGYEVNAFDFLVKPLAYELFCIKFEKALSHIDRSEAYYIKIPNGAKKVSPGQITYRKQQALSGISCSRRCLQNAGNDERDSGIFSGKSFCAGKQFHSGEPFHGG